MEAFILADRVVTAQHMARQHHDTLKYLKRYDLPSRTTTITTPKEEWPHSHPHPSRSHTEQLNFHKIKNLLSTLGSAIDRKNHSSFKENRIDKYFCSPTDTNKQSPEKKSKNGLLIRKVNPRCQQYDANMKAITHKAPCWTFTPHNRQIGSNTKCYTLNSQPIISPKRATTSEKWQRNRERLGANRVSDSQEYVLEKVQRKIYEEMRERSGLGEFQHECKLQYSPQDLGRCAIQIFKKYELDKHAYFKKFMAEIQHLD